MTRLLMLVGMGGACLWCGDELVGGKMDGRFHGVFFFFFGFLDQGFWVLLVITMCKQEILGWSCNSICH